MADWVTISALATAGGTLILAGATFSAVRSANRSARVTERALLAGIRPVLITPRLQDPPEKVGFGDDHWVKVEPMRAVAELTDSAIYLAFGLRNVGTGLAVLDRWSLQIVPKGETPMVHDPELLDRADFRRLSRDLYIADGDLGYWQGALRDRSDPLFVSVSEAIRSSQTMMVDLLYGDHEGGQRTISRFMMRPRDDTWLTSVVRHWHLDREDPR